MHQEESHSIKREPKAFVSVFGVEGRGAVSEEKHYEKKRKKKKKKEKRKKKKENLENSKRKGDPSSPRELLHW